MIATIQGMDKARLQFWKFIFQARKGLGQGLGENWRLRDPAFVGDRHVSALLWL
jgi:hypothetical protein